VNTCVYVTKYLNQVLKGSYQVMFIQISLQVSFAALGKKAGCSEQRFCLECTPTHTNQLVQTKDRYLM